MKLMWVSCILGQASWLKQYDKYVVGEVADDGGVEDGEVMAGEDPERDFNKKTDGEAWPLSQGTQKKKKYSNRWLRQPQPNSCIIY